MPAPGATGTIGRRHPSSTREHRMSTPFHRVATARSAPLPGAFLRWVCALVLLAFAGCTHITLIGDYDEVIDQGVTALQKKTETYYAHLGSTPNTAYSADFYDGVDADLATLMTRAQATPQYGLIAQQLAELQKTVNDMRALDQITPRPVTKDAQGRTAFTNSLSTFEQHVGQILRLQLALKRGEDGAKTSK
jgi:hypothetical protein